MSDILVHSPNHDTLAYQLKSLGIVDDLPPMPSRYQGELKNGDKFTLIYYYVVHYKFDNVDETVPQEGVYARFMVEPPEIEEKPFHAPIEQYWYSPELDYWTNDGINKSPRLIWNIGHTPID